MNPAEEKYKAVNTKMMILAIQEYEIIRLAQSKKPPRTKKVIAQSSEIMEMKSVVRNRLMQQDRNKAEFFPIDCHVSWSKGNGEIKKGIVLQHYVNQNKVFVKFTDEHYDLLVEPQYLTLLYLR